MMDRPSSKGLRPLLEKLNIPYKRLGLYGSQIVVTTVSESAARRWALALGEFSTVSTVLCTMEDVKVSTKGSFLVPQSTRIWRVYATI
jgi:hypothetical protein